MHTAEEYLRDPNNVPYLYVRIGGKRRKLFINRDGNEIGILAPRKKRYGHLFCGWDTIEKIYFPTERSDMDTRAKQVAKYRRMAHQASFTSPYLREIQCADPTKCLYENHITTGTRIDGQVITLNAVEKWCGEITMQMFRQAVRNCESFHSTRFNFRGYDGSLWVEPCKENERDYQKGDLRAGFSKEFRDCGNGYYYLLINDENFIGYDID